MNDESNFTTDFLRSLIEEASLSHFKIHANMNGHKVTIHVEQVMFGEADMITLCAHDLLEDSVVIESVISRRGQPSGDAEVFFWRLLVQPTDEQRLAARNYGLTLSRGTMEVNFEDVMDESFEYGGSHDLHICSDYRARQ